MNEPANNVPSRQRWRRWAGLGFLLLLLLLLIGLCSQRGDSSDDQTATPSATSTAETATPGANNVVDSSPTQLARASATVGSATSAPSSPEPTSTPAATSTAETPGATSTAAPTASATTPAAVSATPTIAPTPSATIVEGHVLDEDGMPLPGLVVRVTHRDGGTGFTTATDGLGHYEGELTPGGGEITVYIQGVAGTTWYATNGDAFVVETGVTTTFDPDVTTGYHLKVTNQTGNPAAVAPSGSYQLQLSYVAWNRTGAPQAHPFLGVGAAADTVTLHELGVPGVFGATSNSGSVTLTLNAPAGSPGQSVTIYAKPVIANTTAAGEADWADRFANAELYIPIGTLTFK